MWLAPVVACGLCSWLLAPSDCPCSYSSRYTYTALASCIVHSHFQLTTKQKQNTPPWQMPRGSCRFLNFPTNNTPPLSNVAHHGTSIFDLQCANENVQFGAVLIVVYNTCHCTYATTLHLHLHKTKRGTGMRKVKITVTVRCGCAVF